MSFDLNTDEITKQTFEELMKAKDAKEISQEELLDFCIKHEKKLIDITDGKHNRLAIRASLKLAKLIRPKQGGKR